MPPRPHFACSETLLSLEPVGGSRLQSPRPAEVGLVLRRAGDPGVNPASLPGQGADEHSEGGGAGWTRGQLPPGRGQVHGQDERRQRSCARSAPIAAHRPEVAAPGVAGAPDTPVLQGEMPEGLAGPVRWSHRVQTCGPAVCGPHTQRGLHVTIFLRSIRCLGVSNSRKQLASVLPTHGKAPRWRRWCRRGQHPWGGESGAVLSWALWGGRGNRGLPRDADGWNRVQVHGNREVGLLIGHTEPSPPRGFSLRPCVATPVGFYWNLN